MLLLCVLQSYYLHRHPNRPPGFFHADPHPGNLIVLTEPRGRASLALIDFGLVASVRQADRDVMVSAIVHLANRDYVSLVDDFIALEILPTNCDRYSLPFVMFCNHLPEHLINFFSSLASYKYSNHPTTFHYSTLIVYLTIICSHLSSSV